MRVEGEEIVEALREVTTEVVEIVLHTQEEEVRRGNIIGETVIVDILHHILAQLQEKGAQLKSKRKFILTSKKEK